MRKRVVKTRRKAKRGPLVEELEESPAYYYITNKWSRTVVQPLLIALVTASFFTAVATVVDLFIFPARYTVLAPLFFLAALEGVYTTLWLKQPRQRQIHNAAYRAAELLVIALILRFYTWILNGNFPAVANVVDYLKYPYLLVVDGPFILGLILTLLAWARAVFASHDFNNLSIDVAEAYYFTLPPGEQDAGLRPAFSDRSLIVAGLFRQWVAAGIILAAATAVVAVDPLQYSLRETFSFVRHLNLPPVNIVILLIYFVAGLLLLSQARLGALNARWLHEGVIKTPDVERTWQRTVTWLLLAIATIALFLPLGSTTAIGHVLQLMVNGVLTLFSLFLYLLFGLLGLFFSPLLEQAPELTAVPQPTAIIPTPAPTPLPTSTAPPDETGQLLLSSAFWAVAIVITVIALSFFLRNRGVRLKPHFFQMMYANLIAWVRGLWRDMSEYAADFQQGIWERLHNEASKEVTAVPPRRFVRLNSLSPRDQVRYFYLSIVKRAGERGMARRQAKTPVEFAEDLKRGWPEVEAEIEELTEAFLRARYSRENIEKEDVNPVKARWKQIKSRLRKRIE